MISLSQLLVSGRANFEGYGISPVSLSFHQPEQEEEYQSFVLRTTIAHIRFSVALSAFIIASYGTLDTLIYEGGSLTYALLIRFCFILPVSPFLFLATVHPRYEKFAWLAGGAAVCLISCGFFMIAYRSNILTVVYTFPAIIMATAFAFFFIGLFFRYAVIAALLANVIYSPAIWSIDISLAMSIGIFVSMLTILFILALAAYQKELISRQLFVTEKRERDAVARQLQNDKRYLEWLRRLAEFLRHEVRNPVAQISSSIEIVQLACKNDDHLKPYLTSAALGTKDVWNLVERASQATDAEAFVRQGQPQPTDLRDLLAEQVAAYTRSQSGIDFRLQCPLPLRVNADATLIKEAVGNLLGNAASFADEASTVTVTAAVNGAQAVIAVSNKGPLIAGDTETLFGPFASTRSGPSSEHQGLGLYLVRLIAERHGGTASLTNLEDGSGVQASITLPLVT